MSLVKSGDRKSRLEISLENLTHFADVAAQAKILNFYNFAENELNQLTANLVFPLAKLVKPNAQVLSEKRTRITSRLFHR